MNKYVGNEHQIYGVEETRLVGGKGDSMRLFNVRNGNGLEFVVSADRCADISRVTFKGYNMGYFSPCGYVSPKYFENSGDKFLKSFTAGFFTTCGLMAVGSPCVDEGEELGLHGTISNVPAECVSHWIENDEIHIKAIIREATLFSYHLLIEREYICPLSKNEIYLVDKIRNVGTKDAPFEILYHCNMGYPLLSENAKLSIPANKTIPRNEHANSGIDSWHIMEKPQNGYEEMCYYHEMNGKPTVSLYNPDIDKEVAISYDTEELKCFTEWKMMGEYEYVLGLEPGNCYPDGRNVMREKGMLETLKAGEERIMHLKFSFNERNK